MRDKDWITCNLVMNPMVCAMNVLHSGLVFQMLHDLNSRSVVDEQRGGMQGVVAKLFEEISSPQDLTTGF